MSSKLSVNPNDAASDKWRLYFQGTDLILFSQKVIGFDIPDVSAIGSRGPSPDVFMSELNSDRIEFAPVSFQFVVDEDYANYRKLFDWMVSNTKSDIPMTRDFYVELLDNRGKTQNVLLEFQEGRPTNLGSFTLDTTAESPTLLCTLMMNFQEMKFL